MPKIAIALAVIEKADHVQLSHRDSLRVLNLLKNPPAPNRKLLAAAEVCRSGRNREGLARIAHPQKVRTLSTAAFP